MLALLLRPCVLLSFSKGDLAELLASNRETANLDCHLAQQRVAGSSGPVIAGYPYILLLAQTKHYTHTHTLE